MSNAATSGSQPTGSMQDVGQRPNENAAILETVTDAQGDIAKNIVGEMIIVGVLGRRRFQKIFIRQGKTGSKTVKSYKPEDDAPPADRTISLLPTEAEVGCRAGTLEFMQVGIILAETPLKYSNKDSGAARDKSRDKKKEERGTLPAERNILRVVVPTTDSITTGNIKYYVACHSSFDLCDMRVITQDSVFFFSEIWEGIPVKAPVKERRNQLGVNCKYHAARDKRPPQRVVAPIAADSSTASNPLSVTIQGNAANILTIQHSLYKATGSEQGFKSLLQSLENLLPDLMKRPSDVGVVAFFDSEAEMSQDEVEILIASLKATYPSLPPLDEKLVAELRSSLCRCKLSGDLPYKNLVLFLRLGHDRAVAGWAENKLDEVVARIIQDIRIVNETMEIATNKAASKMGHESEFLHNLLSGIRVFLQQIIDYFRAQAKELREQHGGIQKYESLDDIMIKISNCVDKTSLRAWMEQVFGIHAEQLATANGNGIKYLESCVDMIDEALALDPAT